MPDDATLLRRCRHSSRKSDVDGLSRRNDRPSSEMSRKRGRVADRGRDGGATARACAERLVNRPAAQADRDVARIERVARADRIDGEVAPDVELVPGAIGVEGAYDRRRTDDDLARPTGGGAAR